MENDPANQPPFKPNSHNSNYRARKAAVGGLVTNTESPASDKAAHGKNKAEATAHDKSKVWLIIGLSLAAFALSVSFMKLKFL